MSRTEPTSPDISVCVANYNGEGYLRDCLNSIYRQRGDFTFEVLLHDDASSDNSADLVRREFPQVRLLESVENVGFCVSNNRMAEAAEGRFILLLNNDARLREGSLEALLAFALNTKSDVLLGLPQHSLHDGQLVDRGYEFDVFMNPIAVHQAGDHEVAAVTGACLWIPRTAWQAIGGFPPWFISVAEDIYLCQAARLMGFPTYMLHAPGFDHWIGKNLGGGKIVEEKLRTTTRRRALSETNKTYVMLLCYPWWSLGPVLLLHAIALFAEAVFLKLSGAEWTKVRKIYLSIAPNLWMHRREMCVLRQHLYARRSQSGIRFMRRFRWLPQKLRMLMKHGTPTLDG